MNPKVDFYFNKAGKWRAAAETLRSIALSSGLSEELKWGCPAYTLDGSNVFLIHVFKEYCALLFFKGALLKDPGQLLVQQTANVQAARQLRFASEAEIAGKKSLISAYMKEAIGIEKSGVKVELKKVAEFEMAEEFRQRLEELPELKTAFESLTPGRQRAYLLHFAAPKLAKTREARVEKALTRILDGKGLDD